MKTRNIVYSGLFIALGVLLPQVFHVLGGPGLGVTFLPMHIPVLLAGFVLGPVEGLLIGTITPIISHLITGGVMPAIPMLYFMIIELGAYGMTASLLHRRYKCPIYVTLIGSMIIGRIIRGGVFVIIVKVFGISLPSQMGIGVAIVQGIPGIILQLITIPIMLVLVEKGRQAL